jgi:dTDP-4-amino-4,6-dideoxygalactose transaminase
MRAQLAAAGIATGIHYPKPVHLQPAYSELVSAPMDLSVSEQLASEFLSLPIFPEMSEGQVSAVVGAIVQARQEPQARVA